jgi:hypothetical protein
VTAFLIIIIRFPYFDILVTVHSLYLVEEVTSAICYTYLRRRAGFLQTAELLSDASVDVVPTLSATKNSSFDDTHSKTLCTATR